MEIRTSTSGGKPVFRLRSQGLAAAWLIGNATVFWWCNTWGIRKVQPSCNSAQRSHERMLLGRWTSINPIRFEVNIDISWYFGFHGPHDQPYLWASDNRYECVCTKAGLRGMWPKCKCGGSSKRSSARHGTDFWYSSMAMENSNWMELLKGKSPISMIHLCPFSSTPCYTCYKENPRKKVEQNCKSSTICLRIPRKAQGTALESTLWLCDTLL